MKQREFAANFRRRSRRGKTVRQRILEQYHRQCWYCGKKLKAKKFRLEHQVPFSRGGSCTVRENIVLACKDCDSAKANRTVDEYRQHLHRQTGTNVVFFGEREKVTC